jgi:hypothetical protein
MPTRKGAQACGPFGFSHPCVEQALILPDADRVKFVALFVRQWILAN